MNISFSPMERQHASEIVRWRYEAPYHIYDYRDKDGDESIDYLCDRANKFFAVTDRSELIGFRSFGEDGRVMGGTYDDRFLDTGGGLRPDLTGQGLGLNLLRRGLEFGRNTYGATAFRTTVAQFNIRAQKVCMKVGFLAGDEFSRPSDGERFVIFTIRLPSSRV